MSASRRMWMHPGSSLIDLTELRGGQGSAPRHTRGASG